MNESIIFYYMNHMNNMDYDAWINQELKAYNSLYES